jgi:cyclopropane fatty-acyl-phospholipid synthase-like methyltransferase
LNKKEFIDNDYIYISNKKEVYIKERYKEVAKIIKNRFKNTENLRILDIGTASGELPIYLKKELKIKKKPLAFDNSENLINNAIERFGKKDVIFFIDDAQTFKLDKKFDVIISCGVISIFDDFKPLIDKILQHLDKKGIGILISLFNIHDIEVRIKYKTKKTNKWQTGYNLFSISNIEDYLKKRGYKLTYNEIIMIDSIKSTEDKIRSWTINCDDKLYLTNGLGLIYNLYGIVIENE